MGTFGNKPSHIVLNFLHGVLYVAFCQIVCPIRLSDNMETEMH